MITASYGGNGIELRRWPSLGAQASSPARLRRRPFARTRQARTPALPGLIQCHCPERAMALIKKVAIPGSAGVLACLLAETALRENPAGQDACAPRLNSTPLPFQGWVSERLVPSALHSRYHRPPRWG